MWEFLQWQAVAMEASELKIQRQKPAGTVVVSVTPPKTNMEPENEPLEEEIPVKNRHF